MATMNPYLNFDGTAEAAFTFISRYLAVNF